MDALFAISENIIRERLSLFMEAAYNALGHHPNLWPLPLPERPKDHLWDNVPTILAFLIEDPLNQDTPLSLEKTRLIHRWLNADLSPWIHHPLAAQLCVLGQPVPLPYSACDQYAGALRLCAGARLVSGEPSHSHLPTSERLNHEYRDIKRVLEKIQLILMHWHLLLEANPIPAIALIIYRRH